MRGSLLLAVGVVDEHLVEALDGELHPRRRSRAEKLHAPLLARGVDKGQEARVLVGVVSDTHGLLRPEVLTAFAGADHILHAGDIGDAAILRELEQLAKVTAVAGNIDGFRCGKARETARVVLGGVRFFLTHILDRPGRVRAEVARDLARAPADVVVFGHSHLPHDETIDGIRFVNPASAGPRRFNLPVSVALVEIGRGKVRSVRFVALDQRSEAALLLRMNQLSAA